MSLFILSRQHKTSTILLLLMPDDFSRPSENFQLRKSCNKSRFTLSRQRKTSIILPWLRPDNITRRRKSQSLERFNLLSLVQISDTIMRKEVIEFSFPKYIACSPWDIFLLQFDQAIMVHCIMNTTRGSRLVTSTVKI